MSQWPDPDRIGRLDWRMSARDVTVKRQPEGNRDTAKNPSGGDGIGPVDRVFWYAAMLVVNAMVLLVGGGLIVLRLVGR